MTTAGAASVWLNGRLLPAHQAVVSVRDRGFLYGDGVFETLPGRSGVALFWPDHLARLLRGLAALGIDGVDPATLTMGVKEVLQAHAPDDGIIRVAISRGLAGRGPATDGAGVPTMLVDFYPMPNADPAPLRLTVVRQPAGLLWRHKTANYLPAILARAAAIRGGFDDALLVGRSGRLRETTMANVFALIDGVVHTPAHGCLPGIVRSLVLRWLSQTGIRANVGPLSLADINRATALFCTNSVMGVRPVAAIGEQVWLHMPLVSDIRAAYEALCDRFVAAHRAPSGLAIAVQSVRKSAKPRQSSGR